MSRYDAMMSEAHHTWVSLLVCGITNT